MNSYGTVGKINIERFFESIKGELGIDFSIIPDPNQYVIACPKHGKVITGLNAGEIIEDIQEHLDIDHRGSGNDVNETFLDGWNGPNNE